MSTGSEDAGRRVSSRCRRSAVIASAAAARDDTPEDPAVVKRHAALDKR